MKHVVRISKINTQKTIIYLYEILSSPNRPCLMLIKCSSMSFILMLQNHPIGTMRLLDMMFLIGYFSNTCTKIVVESL